MNRLRNFGFLLKDVSRLSARNFERRANEIKLGLTLEQCRVLFTLQRHQGTTQVQLANLTDIDQMTLVRILDRIEQSDWLERRPDPDDRRVWRLYLKPTALPILKEIWTVYDHARRESLAGLGVDDIDLLVSLLERIRSNLTALVPGVVESERRRSHGEPVPKPPKSASRTGKAVPGSGPRAKASKVIP